MIAKTYRVTITGETPLLMHNDNLSWADAMSKWGKDPATRAGSVAGDDRTPAWRWIGNLYVDGGKVCIPSDNLMTVLREGGAKCPTGKKGATFKRQTQSGLVVDQAAWPLVVDGGRMIDFATIKAMIDNAEFSEHEALAESLGFALFVKRARIGQAKHVRVRPRFDIWSASGSITVVDPDITRDTLRNILTFAGVYAGVGDWRPSSPKSPGSFGKFSAVVE